MTKPLRFSIIIPTRDRGSTLLATLRTCLAQDYSNFEIIVSDNCSTDHTKEVVLHFKNPNIKYINTKTRVSMSQNWEFALQHATGDFVTILGDDDGLLMGSLSEIERIIENTKTKAVAWKQVSYHWPNHIIENQKNLMSIPLSKKIEKRNAKDYLQRVLNFDTSYDEISFLYKGMIHKSVIEKVKNQSGGIFFHSQTPDLYAAIVLSNNLENYIYSEKPFSINGASGSSNGTSQFNQNLSNFEYKKFSSESNIPFHSKLSYCPSISMLTAECFYQASDHIPEFENNFYIDPFKFIESVLNDALSSPKWRFEEISIALQRTIEINQWNKNLLLINKKLNQYKEKVFIDKNRFGFLKKEKIFCIDGSQFSVKDVYDASLLTNFILNYQNFGLIINHPKSLFQKIQYKFRRVFNKINKLF